MFGSEIKEGMKKALAEFNQELAPLPPSPDPVVRLIVKFIQALSKAFD
jgi:hypothetical protein